MSPADPKTTDQRFPEEHAGPDGWTDWIHPLPGYRMQCCDCGLIHRLELRVDDLGQPNLRMARDEEAVSHE